MNATKWVGLAAVAAAIGIGTGCGRCKGGIRAVSVDVWEDTISFTVRGDGPGGVTSDELRALSGIDEATFVIEGPDGLVDAPVSADWGGHSCMNGVWFGANVEGGVPGSYEGLLYLDALAWPYLGPEDQVEERGGERVLVARGELTPAEVASE